MKRTFIAALMVLVIMGVTGCGGGNETPIFATQILSDPIFDGDISLLGTSTVTQGNTQSVFAGVDPVTGEEFRAFLDFPLGGPGGVPLNAIIVSAFLNIFIDSVQLQPLATTIPISIDLVSFQPPNLIATDFDRAILPALATTSIIPPISLANLNRHLTVDVTSLMVEAQRLGLPDFQVRIFGTQGAASPGLIEIDDTTVVNNRASFAPLLQVTFF